MNTCTKTKSELKIYNIPVCFYSRNQPERYFGNILLLFVRQRIFKRLTAVLRIAFSVFIPERQLAATVIT
jgi:hypothetical protein